MNKPAPTNHPVASIIANRWSARTIDPARPVERDKLMSMLEAARWAPSCFGDQPWCFLFWDRDRDAHAWEQAASILVQKNQLWARNAPVLILSCAKQHFNHDQKPNRWAQYDTGAAAENLHLQGVELGLVVHQMGGFNAELARERFNIPDEFIPMAMIALGYPGKLDDLAEEFRSAETAARQRNQISQFVFEGCWTDQSGESS